MRFLDDATEAARLPVVLLSGFLGSGKTTLLNALLRDPVMRDTAVAINEFGAVPIDQHLVESEADSTVVLANGCLCCNVSGDVEGAVMRIFARRQEGALPCFARLIVEPSGLADPVPIAQALLRNPVLSRLLRLEAMLTTVDAVFGSQQLAAHPEARVQVSFADQLLLTKTDQVAEEAADALSTMLARLNPTATLLRVTQGQVDPAALFPARFLGQPGAPPAIVEWLTARPHAHAGHEHSAGVASLSLVSDTAPDWRSFEDWLRRVRIESNERLLRVKGLIGVPGRPGPVVIQGVRHVLHPPVALANWPDSDHRSRLVLITQDLPHAPLRAGWDALSAIHA